MKQLETWIERITLGTGALVLTLMVLQIVIDVAMRAMLGEGFPATSELVSKYYMVAVSFLPIAYAEVRRRHVESTIFTDTLPARAKALVLLLGFLLSVLVYSALCWGSALEAVASTRKGAYVETGVHMFYTWPSYWILPVSFALMVLISVLRVVEAIRELITRQVVDHGQNQSALSLAQLEE